MAGNLDSFRSDRYTQPHISKNSIPCHPVDSTGLLPCRCLEGFSPDCNKHFATRKEGCDYMVECRCQREDRSTDSSSRQRGLEEIDREPRAKWRMHFGESFWIEP